MFLLNTVSTRETCVNCEYWWCARGKTSAGARDNRRRRVLASRHHGCHGPEGARVEAKPMARGE
jgi:hypothetical protein